LSSCPSFTRLARAIGLKVVEFEAERRTRESATGANAAALVLRGDAALNRPSSQSSMIEARTLFDEVLQIEPNNTDALAGLATTFVFEFVNGSTTAAAKNAWRAPRRCSIARFRWRRVTSSR
jgi:hypothetical protein